MRDPRAGLPWSRRRVRRRGDYAAWMASSAWLVRRAAWRDAWVATDGPSRTVWPVGGPGACLPGICTTAATRVSARKPTAT